MTFSSKLPVALFGAVATIVLVQPYHALGLDAVAIAEKTKTFTVRIDGPSPGTGVIIEKNGNTYSVLTNWHVMNREGNYQITTSDNRQHPILYNQVRYLETADLAVVQFTSNQLYATAELGDSGEVREGKALYVAGWAAEIRGIPERIYMFLPATVVSLVQRAENGYGIIHDNPTTPGTSGGPMLDDKGRVVAINGRFTSEANTARAFGMAIPLQTFLAARNNLSPPPGIALPEDAMTRGEGLAKAGNYRQAISVYNEVLAINSNHWEALYRRGDAYYRLKDYPAAIRDFEQVLRLNPNNATVYLYRGTARSELGEYQAAIADLDRAIGLNPNNAAAYHHRGLARYNLREYQAAIADYDRAIGLNPNDANAYYNRGLVYQQLGDKRKALTDFREAAALYQQEGRTQDYQDAQNRIRELQ